MSVESTFLVEHGWANARYEPLAGDASARRYIRLYKGPKQSIVMIDPTNQTAPFSAMSRHLRAIGLSAPEVFAEAEGLMLIEDFGDNTVARVITNDPTSEIPLYRAAADVLCHLETAPLPEGLATAKPETLAKMIEPVFTHYVPTFGNETTNDAAALVQELEACLTKALPEESVLVLRDHHAENMMWLADRDGLRRVGLLDFQDALLGPPVYDLVSMLQDARRDVTKTCVEATIRHYADRSGRVMDDILAAYHLLGLQRNLRILGIFTQLAKEREKPSYLDLIPRVWGHIQTSLHSPVAAPLRPMVEKAVPHPTDECIRKVKEQCQTR